MSEAKVTEYHFPKGIARIHGDTPPREALEQFCIRLVRSKEKASAEKEAQNKAS